MKQIFATLTVFALTICANAQPAGYQAGAWESQWWANIGYGATDAPSFLNLSGVGALTDPAGSANTLSNSLTAGTFPVNLQSASGLPYSALTGAPSIPSQGLTNLATNVIFWPVTLTNTGSSQVKIYFDNGAASGWLAMSAGGFAFYVNGVPASLHIGQIFSDGYAISSDGAGNLTAASFIGSGANLTGLTAGQISGAFPSLSVGTGGYFAVNSSGACQALSFYGNSATLGAWTITNLDQLIDPSGTVACYSYADYTGTLPPANTILTSSSAFPALTISGTTNQIIFGATNTPPASTNIVTWVSVQVTGKTNQFRVALYQ